MMTSILNKAPILALILVMVSGFVSGSHYYEHDESGYDAQDSISGFSIPEYESQSELLTQLVAPFLLITLILQFGFERALRFVLDDEHNPIPGQGESEHRRQSMMMALAITGMLVPTPFFSLIRQSVSAIFGSLVVIFFAIVIIGFFLKVIG